MIQGKRILIYVFHFLVAIALISCGQLFGTNSSSPGKMNQLVIAKYDISLMSVERPPDAKDEYGRQVIKKIVDAKGSRYYFEDRMVGITWSVNPDHISCIFYSKIDDPIEISWAEAAFIDVKGSVHKPIEMIPHSETGQSDMGSSPRVTKISGKDILVASAYPADYIHGKKRESLLPNKSKGTVDELRLRTDPLIGKSFRMILPLRVRACRYDYVFIFRIENAEVTEMEYQPPENASENIAQGKRGGKKAN